MVTLFNLNEWLNSNPYFLSSFFLDFCEYCWGGYHLSSLVVATPFHFPFFFFFGCLCFMSFVLFLLSIYRDFRCSLWKCFCYPLYGCFDFPFVSILVFPCGYFYFVAIVDKKVVYVYFERRHILYIFQAVTLFLLVYDMKDT